ncbi:hypothetical protein [Amycolatopsis thailandensis]|uniref:hypothetical protein n=1 Tax=Amycolatopsis thailandensis TaxID=589330 RepID=UPI00117759A0|nr:hypothetical protein [Amycolatopsis thailandensis]
MLSPTSQVVVEAFTVGDAMMGAVSDALVELAEMLRRLPARQRVETRRFLPADLLDTLAAAANLYMAVVKLGMGLEQVATSQNSELAEDVVQSLRDLARDVDREARIVVRYLVATTEAERTRARTLGFPADIDLEPLHAIRRGLEIRADLVDIGDLLELSRHLRMKTDARPFAASRLIPMVVDVSVIDNAPVSQFADHLSDALLHILRPVYAEPVTLTELGYLSARLDTVRTLLHNVVGADLRNVDLDSAPLIGLVWSSTTQWPPGFRDRVTADSIPVGDDLFQVIGPGNYRPMPAQPHVPKPT